MYVWTYVHVYTYICIYILKGILEEADDVLVNVNITEAEKAIRNVNLKKKKADYDPYEEIDIEEVIDNYILHFLHVVSSICSYIATRYCP